MDHEVRATKISHIAEAVRRALANPRSRYFDPVVVEEWFVRFAAIRKELKRSYGDLFSDLPDRALPKASGTSDHEGRGYIRREDLDKLLADCELCWGLLRDYRTAQESRPVRPSEEPERRIFVSHASRDKPLVEFFVEKILRLGLEIKTSDIFCTSLEGMDIKNGEDFRRRIQSALSDAKVIILIVTPNYKASEVCLNEMGAAWASDKLVIPLVVEPINYKSVGVLMELLQISRISSGADLSKLKDDLVFKLDLGSTKTALWDAKKQDFLKGLEGKVVECKFPTVLSQGEIENIVAENRALRDSGANQSLQNISSERPTTHESLRPIATGTVSDPQFAEFERLKDKVSHLLAVLTPVEKTIVLCDYFHLDYQPPLACSGDVFAAIRKKLLREAKGGHGVEVERNHATIQAISAALTELKNLIEGGSDPSLGDIYGKIYKSPFDVESQEFWEEHFGLKVPT